MALDVVYWNLALATGGRLAPKGPDLQLSDAREAVLQLRSLADEAVLPVRECTGMVTASDAPQAAVIDRQAWIDWIDACPEERLALNPSAAGDGVFPRGQSGRCPAYRCAAWRRAGVAVRQSPGPI